LKTRRGIQCAPMVKEGTCREEARQGCPVQAEGEGSLRRILGGGREKEVSLLQRGLNHERITTQRENDTTKHGTKGKRRKEDQPPKPKTSICHSRGKSKTLAQSSPGTKTKKRFRRMRDDGRRGVLNGRESLNDGGRRRERRSEGGLI